ncbi:MAG: family 2A encapsulin nanocompartment cargo protein cysteine desulfurase [Tepidisphaeraceae bacterium]|jgi:cysteine desulfurase/selenocysteine lyase
MSTSDLPKEAAEIIPQAESLISPTAAGLPDEATMTKMANEFFRAMPGQDQARESFVADPQSVKIPTEEELRKLPDQMTAESKAATATSSGGTSSVSSWPGIPGGISASDFSRASSFSFLEEARSLFATASAATIPGAPAMGTVKIPYETEMRGFETSLSGGKTPPIPGSFADLASPQIPGLPMNDLGMGRMGSFDFLQDVKSLDLANPQSTLSKTGWALGAAPFSDLSSIPFDVNAIRRDFPILQEKVNGRQLVWLDNAATTHKPQSVIDRLSYFYSHENSNIHRAAHTLAARATDAYEAAREKVRRFLNASTSKEIIFVRGATEGINLVAQSWGKRNIQKDDEIVITWLEHHANIVPWQMLCAEKGAKLRVAPVDSTGQVLLDEYERLLNQRTRLVAFAHVSNALGTVTPVEEMIAAAHRHGAKVLVDGAQAVSHLRVDVQAYDCDFYVFSGHKVLAPTGIGVVYGKADVLENTPPWQGGGNMITDVTFEKTTYQTPPGRFEAGTGSIGDAVGLGAAIDYLERIGMVNVARYEHDLLLYATEQMQRIPGLHLIGTAREKASVLSFVLDGFRTEDVGSALNQEGIAVRSGHHCAQPILRRFGVETTVRPSLALYNTCEDVDALVTAIWNLKSGRNPSLL